ncbi:MAG: cycloartenol synthase, partial [Verrucomicrobiales bacterium]|nr:cycloartenol synthase [Verrucomicrobiales bacterium]
MELIAAFKTATLLTATAALSPAADLRPENLSLKLEVERAIQRGNTALFALQDKQTGIWGDEIYPALTALPLTAIMGDPTRDAGALPPSIDAAYAYLAKAQKLDGGIYGKGLAVYNTSLSVMALLAHDDRTRVQDNIAAARRFLMNQQSDFDRRGK